MQRRTPAMTTGSLRVSPFVVGLVASVTVHAAILGALNFMPKRSAGFMIASPVIEFSLGEPIIITDSFLREMPLEALALREPSDPPRTPLPWLDLEPHEVAVEPFEPRDPPLDVVRTTVVPPLIVSVRNSILSDEVKLQPRRDPQPVQTNVLAIAEAAPRTDDSPGVSQAAEIVRLPAPVYPTSCRRLGHQGTVLLQVLVRDDGSVASVCVAQRSPCPQLDRAAQDAVRTARFRAATGRGAVIDSTVLIPFRFQLR